MTQQEITLDGALNKIIDHCNENDYGPEIITQIGNWIDSLRYYHIVAHYFALHPDREVSESKLTLSVLTDKGIHGFNFPLLDPDTYNYIPLNSIEWIREYRPIDSRSYVIQISIPKTSLYISDNYQNTKILSAFATEIRKRMEGI